MPSHDDSSDVVQAVTLSSSGGAFTLRYTLSAAARGFADAISLTRLGNVGNRGKPDQTLRRPNTVDKKNTLTIA